MAAKKSKSKRLYWQDVMKRQARSGLSIRQFCAKEDVSEPSFYFWRRELRAGDHELGAKPQPGRSRPQQAGPGFVPVELIDSRGTLELIHPLGCRVRITDGVNTVVLRQVLDMLDERGCV